MDNADIYSKIAQYMMGIHELLVFVRSNLRESYCKPILDSILQLILLDNIHELPLFGSFKVKLLKLLDDSIRDSIATILDFSELEYKTDNIDEIYRYVPIIRASILKIIKLLENGNYEQALALLNTVHCLPEALLCKGKWNHKSFWNRIKLYRKKWDKDFIKKEEYNLKHWINIYDVR